MSEQEATLDIGRVRKSHLDEVVVRLLSSRLGCRIEGVLQLTLPSGRCVMLGTQGEITAALRLKSYGLAFRALRRGTIGFADSYMAGEIETPDLKAVMEFFLENFAQFENAGGGWFKTRIFDRIGHRRRANTKNGSKRNIAAHYDLGNDFYRCWLDDGMTYSSAIYDNGDESLETAQDAKLSLIADAVGAQRGERVLEIGCGWGSLAEKLGLAGCEVTAITVSAAQLSFTQERIRAAQLGDLVDVRFQDYRDVSEMYDRIVSVEMIEAVGEKHWPRFFAQLWDRLRPGGVAAIQAITIDRDSFETYRRHPDFIQRYIFPGGMLPSVDIMKRHGEASGFKFDVVQEFGQSYARTLRAWRSQFLSAWPSIAKMGFDERFKRMWVYYLTYCEVGFERGLIDVGVYRFKKPL